MNDIKTLCQGYSRVRGPEINTEVFPYPLYCYLEFTEDGMKFELAGVGKEFTLSHHTHTDVWASNCSFTILNMLTNQHLCTANCEDKPLLKLDHRGYSRKTYTGVLYYACDVLTTTMNEKIENFLQDNSLVVEVVVTIINVNDYCQINSEVDSDKSKPAMLKNIKSVYETNSFTDVVIKVQEKLFNVHKVVLSSASEVFQELFEESSESTVELFDITPDIFSDLLSYIYTGTTASIKSNTTNILLAADRFCIKDLVSQCIYELQLKFTSTNVAETLGLADELKHQNLVKNSCIPFMRLNYPSVVRSDAWKTLKEKSNSLALEIIEKILS